MAPSANNEKQIETELTYQYKLQSSEGHAFNPIVASGKNAITLHYEDNNQSLKSEDLLLIDTRAMWGMHYSPIFKLISTFNICTGLFFILWLPANF